MSKLRAAAKAVLKNTKNLFVCCSDFNHSKKDLHRDKDLHRNDNCPPYQRYNEALAELEAALAEPAIKESLTVAEPVGWLHWLTVDGERFPQLTLMPRTDKDEPLYTVPLIEAKLKEKNT